jgi:uncharacterized protein (DUF2147 family)
MRAWLAGLCLALAAVGAAPAVATHMQTDAEPAILGHWLSEKEKLIVEFYPCGDEVCGRIAWLANTHKDGKLRRDVKNPDPALRDRPWCGIQVIRGLEPEGDGTWDGGHVYDPKRGETYRLAAEAKGEDRLKLRAYLGIKLLGKTETWTRPGPEYEIACTAES